MEWLMAFALTREGIKPIANALALALALFQVWFTSGFGVLDGSMMRVVFVSFITALIFLYIPFRKFGKDENEPIWCVLLDLCLAILALSVAVWFGMHLEEITTRMRYIDEVSTTAKFFGCVTVLLVFEITRRTTGWALVIVSGALVLYTFFGDMLPRAVKHTGFDFGTIVEHLFLLNEGVYGIPIGTATSTLFGFIMFGTFLEKSGMSSIFMDLACYLTRNSQGGPAKVAIFASALFGTISGSASANVYGTGIFTIPLMKKVGYRAPFAGAVEAVASTGGQLMPPVMGTAAFLMADLSGAGYLSVAKAALIPAILYYLSLLFMIHFEAVKYNLGKLDPEMVPSGKSILRRLYYLLPIGVLIALLACGRNVVFCANVATLSIIFLGMFRKETRFTFRSFLEALVASSRGALMVSACCAASGVIVGTLSLTGIGYKFINLITIIAGDSMILLMVLLMLTSFVLGMGVPTTPAYIVVATLGAPALIKAGAPVLVSHMFVFYYAILSFITPPVCVAAFAGAAIAGSKAMETGFIAMKLGIVAFIVPYMFVFEPALLSIGSTSEILWAATSAIVGAIAIAGGMQGYLLANATIIERILLLTSGVSCIYPGLYTDFLGFGCLALTIALQLIRRRSAGARPQQA